MKDELGYDGMPSSTCKTRGDIIIKGDFGGYDGQSIAPCIKRRF